MTLLGFSSKTMRLAIALLCCSAFASEMMVCPIGLPMGFVIPGVPMAAGTGESVMVSLPKDADYSVICVSVGPDGEEITEMQFTQVIDGHSSATFHVAPSSLIMVYAQSLTNPEDQPIVAHGLGFFPIL